MILLGGKFGWHNKTFKEELEKAMQDKEYLKLTTTIISDQTLINQK
jgi:hypothetical protein